MLRALRRKPKIFCVGFNKTGTTSLEQTLQDLGYRLGKQSRAERLIGNWAVRDFRPIIDFCRSADAFQDVPFSLPFTYQALDHAFPGSKFILTVRHSSDAWFDSLERFHRQMFSKDQPVEEQHLAAAKHCYPGWILDYMKAVFAYPTVPLYDKQHYTAIYERHNQCIRDYFSNRPADLLEIDITAPDAYSRLMAFLGIDKRDGNFPWLQRSS